jgi:hypothetical protein
MPYYKHLCTARPQQQLSKTLGPYLQECAAPCVNALVQLRHHLLCDLSLHLELVPNLTLRLHPVGHVNEGLAQVNANDLTV